LSLKGSYRQKHLTKNPGFDLGAKEKNISIQITEEQRFAFESGKVLLIDKPLHWTSFDVVRKIRGIIRIKKVGHAGTLDPLATGLLIVCTGKFTKKINEYMAKEKEYTGSFVLGAVTSTYDLESEPGDFKEYAHINHHSLEDAVQKLTGHIRQFPPIYSAIKKKGTPLYELARRGEEVELEARNVFIKSFEITCIDLPRVDFKIVCSTGTYIRSVANDFGKLIGCGAYLSSLRRTRIGDFSVDGASSLDEFIKREFGIDPV
jgi:tRNA pseudouridine55 synthase